MTKKLEKKFILVTIVYFVLIAALSIIIHNVSFGYAADYRAGYGIYNGIGSEILLVPMFLAGSYWFWKKIVFEYFDNRISEVKEAKRILRNPSTTEYIVMRKGKIVRVYFRNKNKLFVKKYRKPQTITEHVHNN